LNHPITFYHHLNFTIFHSFMAIQKVKEEVQKTKEEVQKEKQEAKKVMLEATKKSVEADKKVEQMIYKMYEDGFSFEQISNYCSLSVDELKSLIKS
jgi:DNA-directed RNA polymerase specialized sigma24 family protein